MKKKKTSCTVVCVLFILLIRYIIKKADGNGSITGCHRTYTFVKRTGKNVP